MKSIGVAVVLLVSSVGLTMGCGNDGTGGTTGASGTSGAGGASGGSVGGTGAGGGAGAGAGGGATGGAKSDGGSAAHCMPGTRYVSSYPYPLNNCPNEFAVRNIALKDPIGPGDKFAFSVDLMASLEGTMDLWGATENCGTKLELLATAPMGVGTRCMEVTPQQGTYSNLVWVWHGAGTHLVVTLCPGGSCGK